jgi:hypothetical protein
MTNIATRELKTRASGGLEVQMRWAPEEPEHVCICVSDHGNVFGFMVPGEKANDAFEHPFVHTPLIGVTQR